MRSFRTNHRACSLNLATDSLEPALTLTLATDFVLLHTNFVFCVMRH